MINYLTCMAEYHLLSRQHIILVPMTLMQYLALTICDILPYRLDSIIVQDKILHIGELLVMVKKGDSVLSQVLFNQCRSSTSSNILGGGGEASIYQCNLLSILMFTHRTHVPITYCISCLPPVICYLPITLVMT